MWVAFQKLNIFYKIYLLIRLNLAFVYQWWMNFNIREINNGRSIERMEDSKNL